MIVIKSKHLPAGIDGLTLFGIVFVRPQYAADPVLLNHERIHCRQQREWGYIPFFVIYLFEWLWNLIRLRNAHLAYRAISFEREAYHHQHDLEYLQHRPPRANFHRLD